MSLLSYESHSDITNHHDVLELFKDFAVARGWTNIYFSKNIQWASTGGGNYNFIAGTESFLAIQSTGNGNQMLHFRLRFTENATENLGNTYLGSQISGGENINYQSSTHPVDQNRVNNYTFSSVKTPTIERVFWFFGNSSFLCIVFKTSLTTVNFIMFGSYELLSSTEAQGNFFGWSTNGNYAWTDFSRYADPTNQISDEIYIDNERKPVNEYHNSICDRVNYFFSSQYSILKNSYSPVRPLTKGVVLVRYNADSLWRCVGSLPVYRVSFTDLEIGEILEYSTKKFIVFPNIEVSREFGLAFRIA